MDFHGKIGGYVPEAKKCTGKTVDMFPDLFPRTGREYVYQFHCLERGRDGSIAFTYQLKNSINTAI